MNLSGLEGRMRFQLTRSSARAPKKLKKLFPHFFEFGARTSPCDSLDFGDFSLISTTLFLDIERFSIRGSYRQIKRMGKCALSEEPAIEFRYQDGGVHVSSLQAVFRSRCAVLLHLKSCYSIRARIFDSIVTMPPKKAPPGPSKKTEQKKKEKVIEDKTFGLKNKKGAKNQKFIQQVQKQVQQGNQPRKAAEEKPNDLKKKKEQELAELNQLFRPVIQKAPKDADPKSVVCAFFKQGLCTKGAKCKFSHDLAQERKAEKKNMYHDDREEDTMENWDEAKLREAVEKKHGAAEKAMSKTDIICKHFLEALELSKYGWFWECPNGGPKCHYRHALPPGFVLKKDRKKDEKDDQITIEELVETERAALGPYQTKITLESFLAWKRRKIEERKETARQETDRKKAEFKAGNKIGLSGRDMFTFNPDMANEDEDGDDGEAFDMRQREDDLDETSDDAKEIDLEEIAKAASTSLPSEATVADKRHWQVEPPEAKKADVPINEDLFNEEDLDGLEDELDDLDVDDEDDDGDEGSGDGQAKGS